MIDKETQKKIAKLTPFLLGEPESKIIVGLLKEIEASREDFNRVDKELKKVLKDRKKK